MLIFLAIFVFLGVGLSFRSAKVPFFVRQDSPKPFPIRIELLEPLKAASDSWGFVKQSATWARGNSLFMDDLIAGIKNNPALVSLASQQTFTTNNFPLGTGGGVFDLKLRLNVPGGAIVAASSVFNTPKTFDHYFEIKVAGTNDIALQFFWDENPRDKNQQGALMIYNLNRLAPSLWVATATIESYVYMTDTTDPAYAAYDQGLIQTYSWSGPLGNDTLGLTAQRGRVILEEMDGGTVFCFKTVVRIDSTANLPNFFNNNTNGKALCNGVADEYYKLAYSQKLDGDLNVTAKAGWEENGVTSVAAGTDDGLCGVPGLLNFGLFQFNGWVSDRVAAANIPSDYVPATRVGNLYSRIGTTGKSGAGDQKGVVWDDLTKAAIDGLNTTVVFRAAPITL